MNLGFFVRTVAGEQVVINITAQEQDRYRVVMTHLDEHGKAAYSDTRQGISMSAALEWAGYTALSWLTLDDNGRIKT